MYIGPCSKKKKLGTLKSIKMLQKENGMYRKANYGHVSCTEASDPERMYPFPGRSIEEGANMHFHADDSSVEIFIHTCPDGVNEMRHRVQR